MARYLLRPETPAGKPKLLKERQCQGPPRLREKHSSWTGADVPGWETQAEGAGVAQPGAMSERSKSKVNQSLLQRRPGFVVNCFHKKVN